MKKIFKIWAVLTLTVAVSACAKEVLEPEQRIRGEYVLDHSEESRASYIAFQDGHYLEMNSLNAYYFAKGKLWGCQEANFKCYAKSYAIMNGELYLNGFPQGKTSLTGDNLQIGNVKYKKLDGLDKRYFFTIHLPEGKEKTVGYASQSVSIPYAINSIAPATHGSLTASVSSSWVKNIVVSDDRITFDVSENNTKAQRSITLLLSVRWAETVRFTLTQSYESSSIELTEGSQSMNDAGGTSSFGFSITNPREGATVTATSQNYWITDVVVSGNTVSYKVAENSSSADRVGSLRLYYGGFATKYFNVNQSGKPVQSISLNKSSLGLLSGQYETLVATVNPADAPLQWTSNNTSVATVNQSGFVYGAGNGTATITVRAENGKYATCDVTVTTAVTSVSLNKTSLTLTEGSQEQLTATIGPSNASDKTVTWSSSNTSVATVDQNGLVTAVSAGTATIKATANDGSGKYGYCTVTVAKNLSANGSANCYVVSSAGTYSFRTTQGNSDTSVGSVSSVSALWESYGTSTTPSVGSIINNVSYSNNVIFFSTPSTLKNGNAVIAAKNSSGTILWSWHIWVCSGYAPESSAHTYYNSAGKMMDRNLGATSASTGNAGALGLLYQWGRKDPFLGSSSKSSSSYKAASTLSWPSAVTSNSSNGKVTYAVAHPTTFISFNNNNYDWYYTGSSSTDNTRWKSTKTIYDPCPPGWKVPAGGSSGVWSTAANTSSSFSHSWNSSYYGMNFYGMFGGDSTIWYPAAGYLYNGSLLAVGSNGYWWSCTPNANQAYGLTISNTGKVYPSDADLRGEGHSVRCVKE
ncbi:MAG: Ig-like domain-containing protein [Bacteroidales bacterium]|nr:Ig-like domain-containing protein [Bacteroidales bacterium]